MKCEGLPIIRGSHCLTILSRPSSRAIRFDLSFALLSYGLMRIQATATANEIYFEVDGFQTAMDLYFFLAFLGVSVRIRIHSGSHRFRVA